MTMVGRRVLACRFRRWFGLLVVLVSVLFPTAQSGCCRAATIPLVQKPVRDEARILDMGSAAALRKICYDLERETTAELCVIILRNTGGENAHEFALRTFNTWGIGRSGIDNGMLLLFAIDDRRVEIIPGIRYKNLFDGSTSTSLLVTHVVPRMKLGKPAEGVFAGAREIARRVREFEVASRTGAPIKAKPYAEAPVTRTPSSQPSSRPVSTVGHGPTTTIPTSGGTSLAEILRTLAAPQRVIFLAFLGAWFAFGWTFFQNAFVNGRLLMPLWLAVIVLALGGIGLGAFAVNSLNLEGELCDQVTSGAGGIAFFGFMFAGCHVCPRCHKWLTVINRTIHSPTYYSTGLGEQTQHCDSCGFHNVSTYTISRRTKSSTSSSSSSSSRSSSSCGSSGGGRSSGGGGGASW